MKKELAIAALTAIIAANVEIKNIEIENTCNEVNMDLYVTGCQCKSPKPHWKTDMDVNS